MDGAVLMTVGGGEILQYMGGNDSSDPLGNMDANAMHQLSLLPGIKMIVLVLILAAAVLVILKILEVKSPFRGKAITAELDNLDKIKKRDEAILQANKFISTITKIIENSPLKLDRAYVDYWTYNLERADIRIPGGYRVIRPQEFNAIIKVVESALVALSLIIALIINLAIGAILAILVVVIASSVPMMYVRSLVKVKDDEIIENFADFYLMLHYVLLASSGTPIAGVMKSFDKTTSSHEMHRFVDVCIHYIDTYGEYDATRYISRQYREIPQVGKLMRLIRQANEGGDVRAELMGFRSELLSAKKYTIEKRMEKTVMKAKRSFYLLMPILVQAVISAMAIYFKDLNLASSFL